MRLTTLAALALTTLPAAADQQAIQGVIDDQIAAFRADDFATAFSFASPNIQGMFRNPDNFGLMVRQGYPMVWRPDAVEYLGVEERGAIWEQDVLITDGAGTLHTLRYTMIETPNGWKINGVQLLRAPDIGA